MFPEGLRTGVLRMGVLCNVQLELGFERWPRRRLRLLISP